MRYFLFFSILALFAGVVHAWTKEDHEIFDLVSAVEAAEGKGTTFYSWLEVSPSAPMAEIGRAYRKKSMLLHPDKNPGIKGAQERFARLGVVASILRSQEGRERYDFFYKNGVPRWRGTGYYYSRFRPGLGTVLVFLIFLTTGLHYVVQRMNYKRDLARIEQIIGKAKLTAWGPKMIPLGSQRKVKVNLGGSPRLDEDGNVLMGRSIDVVVESNGDVFMLEGDGEQTHINANTATPPSLRRTWFIGLVHTLVCKVFREEAQGNGVTLVEGSEDGETATGTDSDLPELEHHLDQEQNGGDMKSGNGKAAPAAMKAGGRRRKAVRKR
ncbi:DnaJ-domain-containing protein [Multifurca ochricompacta]|uniref:DnaJ-domain-containing protein n=1 Tax=Multifurca ochricompacta TaxID=376703 RepID=A0AAD4QSW2_9AGAM|nr:DnaJ-domain-containing protein [Multifurca ochricompacta]